MLAIGFSLFFCKHNNHWRLCDEGMKVDVWGKAEFVTPDRPGRCVQEPANRSCFAFKTQKQQQRFCDSLDAFEEHFTEKRFKAEINNKMCTSGMKNYFGKIFWLAEKLDLVPDTVHQGIKTSSTTHNVPPYAQHLTDNLYTLNCVYAMIYF